MKFTIDPTPTPPESGALISTDKLSLLVITIGYVLSKNVVSFGAISTLRNLFAVIPYPVITGVVLGLMYRETLAVPRPVSVSYTHLTLPTILRV